MWGSWQLVSSASPPCRRDGLLSSRESHRDPGTEKSRDSLDSGQFVPQKQEPLCRCQDPQPMLLITVLHLCFSVYLLSLAPSRNSTGACQMAVDGYKLSV